MPLKSYETIGILNRHLTAIIDGARIPIAFLNGTSSPRLIQGRYTTSNPVIQAWIEKSGDFNRKYRLVSIVQLPGDKKVAHIADDNKALVANKPPQAPEHDDLASHQPDMNIPEETDEDLLVEEPEVFEPDELKPTAPTIELPLIVNEVVNGQQARNYLMEHYKELTFRQVQGNAQIITEAKSRNVQFIMWDAFVTAK